MSSLERRLAVKLQMMILLVYASNACFFAFQPVYFSDRRLSFTQIGIAFAVGSLVSIVALPIWGYLSDRVLNKKKTLLATILPSILLVLMFITLDNFFGIILLVAINGLFIYGIYPIIDAYTFDVIELNQKMGFAHFRVMASIGYGLANLALGFAIKFLGINVSFIAYALLSGLCLLLLLTTKFEGKKHFTKVDFKMLGQSLRSVHIVVLLITVFLMNAAFMGGVNYMNELIKFTGGDVSNLGMAWFITCMVEVGTFYFTNKLIRRIGVVNVYIISTFIYAIKFALDFFLKTPELILSVQVLEGIAFTLFITSSLIYLNENTRPEARASMMSICGAFGGFGCLTAGLFGGILLNVVNPSQLYGIFALVCLTATLLAFLLRRKASLTTT